MDDKIDLSIDYNNVPRAGDDGTFTIGGKVWGTTNALAPILSLKFEREISDSLVRDRVRVNRLPHQLGLSRSGSFSKFYLLESVEQLFVSKPVAKRKPRTRAPANERLGKKRLSWQTRD